jgi:predicted nucleic acid-binding protein
VISVQALQETAHVLRRKAGMDLAEVGEALAVLRALLDVVPMTEATHLAALRIAAATGYSIWDAAMLAAAAQAGCAELLSEAMQAGRVVEGVRIVNPFG